jgi:zinc D-Ala-D-Ala carboxypeptidase
LARRGRLPMVDGITRVTSRISDLEDRLAAFASFAPVSMNAQGWAPGLSGAGQPRNVYNATELQSPSDRGEVTFSDTMVAAEVAAAQAASPTIDLTGNGTSTLGIGGTPAFSPPPELLAYGNGNVPAEALDPIGIGGHRLYHPAAQAFMTMRADAAAAGIDIGVTDSYRSYTDQVDLVRRKGSYQDGGLGATPGTSKHGWGVALDIKVDARGQEWMRANGARYGFYETTPREPWHWEFRGLPTGTVFPPIAPPPAVPITTVPNPTVPVATVPGATTDPLGLTGPTSGLGVEAPDPVINGDLLIPGSTEVA